MKMTVGQPGPYALGSLRCDGDVITHSFEPTNQNLLEVVLGSLVEVSISQLVVRDLPGKHMENGAQNLVAHREGGSFVPASSFDAVELIAQVGPFAREALWAASTSADFK